ncbi:hypothetical protein QYE76_026915 [Lolium multiflorum]|uniref:CCHC-type domain-containing protein n=1 Tax=Lolium multiflorum TaxID=4521 RepID=A0AAD8RGX2_LOLMU|nr:hypothetical protein QYE76_026915 [Lolium multiflorum]
MRTQRSGCERRRSGLAAAGRKGDGRRRRRGSCRRRRSGEEATNNEGGAKRGGAATTRSRRRRGGGGAARGARSQSPKMRGRRIRRHSQLPESTVRAAVPGLERPALCEQLQGGRRTWSGGSPYEEGASIARGGEEQLDKKLDKKLNMELDMELDMKISHGRARGEEACAKEDEVQSVPGPVGPAVRQRARSGPKNKDAADVMTWREYEALRNEMRHEFRTQDDELKGTVQEVAQNNRKMKMKMLSFKMKHVVLVVVLDVVTVVVALLNSELAVSLHNRKTMVWFPTSSSKPVSNVSNTKKSEPAASTSGSSMSTARNRDMACHTCGGKGHFKRDCPNRKVMFINEDNEYETGDDADPYAPEEDDYDSDGVDAYPSKARTIVVSQHALNVFPSASTQRCNLFQTKALVGPDKACKVIIDGGSCRNLASKELCTKLKLKYLPHLHPYYIQWLSDNGEMKVNHMVRVDFEIGLYKDSTDFDVVPMTESHAGGLMGHFGREKTLLMLADHFYWPKMRRDVDRYVKRSITCNKSKSKLKPHGLYTPLPAPTTPWEVR